MNKPTLRYHPIPETKYGPFLPNQFGKTIKTERELFEELDVYLTSISKAEENGDVEALRSILKDVVSGFTPEKEIVDVVYLQKNKD